MSKNLKDKIKILEEKNRVLPDNLIDAVWTLDVETLKFDYITDSIKKISGFTADEYINCPIQDRLTQKSFKLVSAAIAEEIPKFKKGEKNIRTMEVELLHKTGTIYWADIRARLVREPGKPLKVVGITREISELKDAEQKQKELIKKLNDAVSEKDRLLKEVKTLQGLLPICSGCKRIRDKNGKWWPLDAYVNKATDAELTHTICTDCEDVFYSDS